MRLVIGIVLSVLGGIVLLDALFVEDSIGEEYIISAVRLVISFSLFAAAYYFGFKSKQKPITTKTF